MTHRGAAGSAILDPVWATSLLRARQAGVPASLRQSVAEHRLRGDWRSACQAASIDVRIDLAKVRGQPIVRQLLHDLKVFAPDLLRWHLPRSLPAGGPQKDLILALAEYPDGSTLALTTPGSAWAAGERVVLDLLDRPPVGRRAAQWRLVHHRHRWSSELPPPEASSIEITELQDAGEFAEAWRMAGFRLTHLDGDRDFLRRLPVDLPRLKAETWRLYGDSDAVAFRPGGGRAIILVPRQRVGPYVSGVDAYVTPASDAAGLPVLPQPSWCRSFEHELLRLGLASASELHSLDAGLSEDQDPVIEIRCRGTTHRIHREQGRWIAPDHDDRQNRAEQFLARVGAPLAGCYQALAELDHRQNVTTARFEAHERYRSALAGEMPGPVIPDVTYDEKSTFRKPPGERTSLRKRGRRNTKPSTGEFIPPHPPPRVRRRARREARLQLVTDPTAYVSPW